MRRGARANCIGPGEEEVTKMARKPIRGHQELEVYQLAFRAAMRLFAVSKGFPREERDSLTDQIRRSSRSVCTNLAEAWRKHRYEGAFLLKLSDAEAEAAETETWLEFAVACQYLDADANEELRDTYDHIMGILVKIIANPSPWLLPRTKARD